MFFLPNVAQMKIEAEYWKRTAERILRTPKIWSPKMKWEKELGIEAESYDLWVRDQMLFPKVVSGLPFSKDQDSVCCPGGAFEYVHSLVPRGGMLDTILGNKQGKVCFTADVVVPTLLKRSDYGRSTVWMSLTPMEVFSLRPGTKLAKGHTVVAGLGLGHQLLNVCRKRGVKKVTLVERDKALVNWLMPRITEKLKAVKPEVVVGDANKLVPQMQADVALIDIESGYGYADFPRCPQIGRVWIWGSASTGKHSIWD